MIRKNIGMRPMTIQWSRLRLFSSTATSSEDYMIKEYQDYVRQLMKKFMFQVHPDYFLNTKQLQDINNQNLRALQGILDFDTPHTQKIDARSLIFYVKPNESFPEPKKVKVATNRAVESISEILETIGIELPNKPADFDYYKSVYQKKKSNFTSYGSTYARYTNDEPRVDSETVRILEFLDSIGDRHELIAMREERNKAFNNIEKELLTLTGLEKIEYWNSWSSHNNGLLLSNISNYVRENQKDLHLPWKGLKLVIAKDDAGSQDIDYIEKCIRIDCSDISAHWMSSFHKISQEKLSTMQQVSDKIQNLQKDLLQNLDHFITYKILDSRHKKKRNSNDENEQQRNRIPSFLLTLERGFTCSERNFAFFLTRMQLQLFPIVSSIITKKNDESDKEVLNSSTASKVLHPNMLKIKLIIEDNYGTKLLDDGNFRIDYQIQGNDFLEFFHDEMIEKSFQKNHEFQLMMNEISFLENNLINILQLNRMIRGIGIDNEKYLISLRNIFQYLLKKNPGKKFDFIHSSNTNMNQSYNNNYNHASINKGILKHLNGIKLVIGHYHGVRDDGGCILPWNFDIHHQQ